MSDQQQPAQTFLDRPLDWSHNPDFGTYLRALREEKGFTQREVAAAIGISAGYVAKIEAGKSGFRGIGLDVLYSAARLFGVPWPEVFKAGGYSGFLEPVNMDAGPKALGPGSVEALQRENLGYATGAFGRSTFLHGSPPPTRDEVVELHRRFRGVVLNPELCPTGLTEAVLDHLSAHLLGAWIEFAERLEKHLRGGGVSIEVLDMCAGRVETKKQKNRES